MENNFVNFFTTQSTSVSAKSNELVLVLRCFVDEEKTRSAKIRLARSCNLQKIQNGEFCHKSRKYVKRKEAERGVVEDGKEIRSNSPIRLCLFYFYEKLFARDHKRTHSSLKDLRGTD